MAQRRILMNSYSFTYVPTRTTRISAKLTHGYPRTSSCPWNVAKSSSLGQACVSCTRAASAWSNCQSTISTHIFPPISSSVHVPFTRISFVAVPQAGEQNVPECKKAIKRCSSGQPLWMTRVDTEVFILCYDSKRHPACKSFEELMYLQPPHINQDSECT